MKKMLNWKVKRHNGQCAYGEWIDRNDVLPSVREWIDTALVEGDAQDGDLVLVEGVLYLIKVDY